MSDGAFLPPVLTRLVGNIDDLAAKIAEAKALIASLSDAKALIRFDVDQASLAAAKATAQAALKAMGGVQIPVAFDISEASLARLAALLGAARGAGGAGGIGRGLGGLFGIGLMGWLSIIHLGLVALASQIIADTAGFIAFGIAATAAIGPVVQAVGNLTTKYEGLDNYQKAAALSLQSFVDNLHKTDEAGIFGVFYQGLDLVKQALSGSGSVTTQATQAFSDFFAMLKADAASPAWAAAFGGGTQIIRKDMDALFQLINHGINLIPAFVHNFNGIGLSVMHVASGFLGATRAMMEWNPTFTKAVALATAAASAYKIFWLGLGAGDGIIKKAYLGVRALGARVAIASSYMSEGAGVAASYALGISGTALAVGGLALVIGGMVFAMTRAHDEMVGLGSAAAKTDGAIGNNLSGYRELAAQLQRNISAQQAMTHATNGTGIAAQGMSRYISTEQGALHSVQGVVSAITGNTKSLGNALGLTSQQVVSFANKVGVDLTHPMARSSSAFVMAKAKIKAYDQAVTLSHHPLSQFKVDVEQSRSASQTLTQQVQDLQASFASLVAPPVNAVGGAAQLKINEDAAASAIRASNHVVGVQTDLQAQAAKALSIAAAQALTQSANIKQMTGSTSKAAGPLQNMIHWMQQMHIHGAMAAAILAKLKAAEDALYNKTVTITLNTIGSVPGLPYGGGAPGTSGSGPGGGHPVASAAGAQVTRRGWSWVGEHGPELVQFSGGQRVIPNHVATGSQSPAGGGPLVIENRLFLDGKELHSVIRSQTYGYNVRNNNRTAGGKVRGTMVPA
jgi:hypothetical protein